MAIKGYSTAMKRIALVLMSLVAAVALVTALWDTSEAKNLPAPNAAVAVQVYDQTGAPSGVAGNPTPSDPVAGDLLNSVADTVAPAAFGSVKATSGTFVSANLCNEGMVTGWAEFFDQSSPDAGGTTDAGAAPKFLGVRVPAGACASLGGARTFTNGIVWYSSSTPGVLTTDAGVPSMTAETFYR